MIESTGNIDLIMKCEIIYWEQSLASRDLLLEFWDSLHISATVDARNFKFGTQIRHWGSLRKNAKLGQKGSWRGHVTYFMQFWDPSRQIGHWGYYRKMQNCQHGRDQGHVTYFFKFWNPSKTVSQTIRKQKTLGP